MSFLGHCESKCSVDFLNNSILSWKNCEFLLNVMINILVILLFIVSINIIQREKSISPSFYINYELSFVLLKNAWFRKIPLQLPLIVLHVSIEVAKFVLLKNIPKFLSNPFIENALRYILRFPEECSFALSDFKWDSVQVKGLFFSFIERTFIVIIVTIETVDFT